MNKRVSVTQVYHTPTGAKWAVKLDGRIVGNVERAGDCFIFYSFPILHVNRRAPSFYRALLSCVKSYVAWIGNYGRI